MATLTELTDADLRAAITLLQEHPTIVFDDDDADDGDKRYAAALWRVIEFLGAAVVNDGT